MAPRNVVAVVSFLACVFQPAIASSGMVTQQVWEETDEHPFEIPEKAIAENKEYVSVPRQPPFVQYGIPAVCVAMVSYVAYSVATAKECPPDKAFI